MRIGEAAELVGVSTRAIRHYHRIGLLPEPDRRANGYRSYRLRDVVALLRIRRLVDLGLSLDEVSDALADKGERDVREILRELDSDLAEQQRRIQQRRDRLAALLADGADPRLPASSADVLAELTDALGHDHPGLARERLILEAMAHAAGPNSADLLELYRGSLASPDRTRQLMAAVEEFEALAGCAPSDARVAALGRAMAANAGELGLRPPAQAWQQPAELERWLAVAIADLAPAQAECMRVCFDMMRAEAS